MILLDTVTISETVKRKPDSHVLAWLARCASESLFLSVITLGEIERGITKVSADEPRHSERLRVWQQTIVRNYSDRLLPFDLDTALEWGRLVASLGRSDVDLQLAATARRHGLSIATRNISHFAGTAITVINPWDAPRRRA